MSAKHDAKLVEREARLDRRYFEALIESSPLAMVSLDDKNRIVSTNGAFEQMFLFARHELVGADLDDMIAPPEDHAQPGSGGFGRGVCAGGLAPQPQAELRTNGSRVDLPALTARSSPADCLARRFKMRLRLSLLTGF